MKTFVFQFHTARQAFEVSVDNHKAYDNNNPGWEKVTGSPVLADVAEPAAVQSLLEASQGGRKLNVKVFPGSNKKSFSFTIDSVSRGVSATAVAINWNGKAIDSKTKGSMELVIPSLNEFTLLSIETVQTPEQYIRLQFSDPLLADQDLSGLITLEK